jgi:importin subunit beta-1
VSILTIGFICQQLKDFNFYFEERLQEPIFTAIMLALKDGHPETVETAFRALRDGMSAFSSVLRHPQFREYLISQMAEALKGRCFVESALQCLIEFVKGYYCLLQPPYVEVLATFIQPFLADTRQENACVLAMEFWTNFARQENHIESNPSLTRYITGPLGSHLVEQLIQNLCAVEEGEEEGNGVSEAAAGALEAIFSQDSSEFEPKILSFTSSTIRHENWKYRQASIRAFALLLIGLPTGRSQQLVNLSLVELVSLVKDGSRLVQLSTVKALSLISE